MKKAKEELISKGIRFPASLLRELEGLAEKERRTFTEQVIYLCEQGMRAMKEEQESRRTGRGTLRRRA